VPCNARELGRTVAMKRSEIRSELLGQHIALRSRLAQACQAAERWNRGEAPRADARACLIQFLDELRKHNLREEELLRDVLPGVDPWGSARAELMSEEHVREHEELYRASSDATSPSDASVALGMINELRESVLDHMAREEKGFLGEDSLRDDEISLDAFGG